MTTGVLLGSGSDTPQMCNQVDTNLAAGPSSALALPPRKPSFGSMVPLWLPGTNYELSVHLSCSALVFLPAVCQAKYQAWVVKVGLCGI